VPQVPPSLLHCLLTPPFPSAGPPSFPFLGRGLECAGGFLEVLGLRRGSSSAVDDVHCGSHRLELPAQDITYPQRKSVHNTEYNTVQNGPKSTVQIPLATAMREEQMRRSGRPCHTQYTLGAGYYQAARNGREKVQGQCTVLDCRVGVVSYSPLTCAGRAGRTRSASRTRTWGPP